MADEQPGPSATDVAIPSVETKDFTGQVPETAAPSAAPAAAPSAPPEPSKPDWDIRGPELEAALAKATQRLETLERESRSRELVREPEPYQNATIEETNVLVRALLKAMDAQGDENAGKVIQEADSKRSAAQQTLLVNRLYRRTQSSIQAVAEDLGLGNGRQALRAAWADPRFEAVREAWNGALNGDLSLYMDAVDEARKLLASDRVTQLSTREQGIKQQIEAAVKKALEEHNVLDLTSGKEAGGVAVSSDNADMLWLGGKITDEQYRQYIPR